MNLAASAIKRNYNVKDYGTLIPGHGGIMDRFDIIILLIADAAKSPTIDNNAPASLLLQMPQTNYQ